MNDLTKRPVLLVRAVLSTNMKDYTYAKPLANPAGDELCRASAVAGGRAGPGREAGLRQGRGERLQYLVHRGPHDGVRQEQRWEADQGRGDRRTAAPTVRPRRCQQGWRGNQGGAPGAGGTARGRVSPKGRS